MTTDTKDTAKYKPVCCYRCGATMRTYTFSDVWNMRIDGKLHEVPVVAVPCMRCDDCDLAVTDGGSDDAIQWSYRQYLKKQGLDTPWLRTRRWVRRRLRRISDRWSYFVYKTFYKKEDHAS